MSKVIDQDGMLLGETVPFAGFNMLSQSVTIDSVAIEDAGLTDTEVTHFVEAAFNLDPVTETEDGPVVRAIILYNPLDMTDRTVCDLVWAEGKTLAEYLDGMPDGDWSVSIGAKDIERSDWHQIELKPLDTIIVGLIANKSIIPIIMIVAMVALAVFQPELVALIGTVGFALLGAAVSVGGMLLTSMLADKPKDPALESQKSSSSYGLDGAKNTSQETLAVPVVYGQMRVAGNKTNIYVENNADNLTQTVFSQFIIGEGEISKVSDLLLNDQPIENFQQAIWDWRAGTQNQLPMQWFSETIKPHNVQAKITPNHYIYETVDEVDRVRIDIAFPSGLYGVNEKTGGLVDTGTALRMFFRRINSDGSLGDIHMLNTEPYWNRIDASTTSTNILCTGFRLTVLATGTDHESNSSFNILAEYQRGEEGAPWLTLASESGTISNVETIVNNAIDYNAGSVMRVYEIANLEELTYNFRVTGAVVVGVEALYSSSFTYLDHTRGTIRHSVTTEPLDRARYHFEFWRDQEESTDSKIVNSLVIVDMNEIKDDLIRYANTAYYGTAIRLGADINSEPNVTALVTGKIVDIYDRNGNVASHEYSNNPADVALDIMLNTRNRFAFNVSRVDFAAFDDWRTYCHNNELFFNGIFDTSTNVWDAMMAVMRVGRGSPILQGLRWSVLIEAPADPVMMFTQDNIIKGTFTNNWTGRKGRANMIEVQYSDASDNFKQHSAFALDESFIAQSEALVQSTIQMRGVTSHKQAQDEAYLQLNLNRYLTQSVEFEIYLQAMGCVVGDVILVQHDMPQWGYTARIVDASVTNKVVIDSDMPFNHEGDWRMLVVRGTSMIFEGAVSSISGKQIQIQNPQQGSIRGNSNALVAYSGEDTTIVNPVSLNGTNPSQILTTYGVDRVLVNGKDYRVTDWTAMPDGSIVLVSDETFSFEIGSTAQAFKNDMMCEANLAPAGVNDRTLTITGWNSRPGSPRNGDIVMIGQVERFKKPFRILKITYKDDHTRTLTCLEYNDSVYGANAHPTQNYSALTLAPFQVSNLRASQVATTLQGGAMQYLARFEWDRPLNDPRGYAGAKIYASVNFSALTLVADVLNPISVYDIPASIDDLVRVKVVAYERTAETANYASAPIAAVQIGSHAVKPVPASGLVAVGGIRQIALRWDVLNDDYVRGFQIWENSSNNLATSYLMYEGKANYYVRANLNPKETRFYWLRTVAITNEFGDFSGSVVATTSELIADDIQNGILDTAKFADSISPVAVFDGVPKTLDDTGGAKIAINTQDGKLYRWTGLGFTTLIDHLDIPGVALASDVQQLTEALTTTYLTSDETKALVASHSAGTLTDEQLSQIKSATVSGLLVDARLNASNIVGQLTAEQIASLTFDKVTGTFSASKMTDVDPATGQTVQGISVASLLGNLPLAKISDVDPVTGNTVVGKILASRLIGTMDVSVLPSVPTSKLVGDILASSTTTLNLESQRVSGVLNSLNIPTLSKLTGAIAAGQIQAGAIRAVDIAAGAITTAKLAVGSPNNVIANSCFYVSGDGWASAGTINPVMALADAANFSLDGLGSGLFQSPTIASNTYCDYVFTTGATGTGRAFNASVPTVQGETWEAQLVYSPRNGAIELILLFVDNVGNLLLAPSSGKINYGYVSSAKTLAEWHQVAVRGTAPSNTVAVGILIRLHNISATPSDPSAYVTRTLLGKTVLNATELLPWTPGGITSVTGGLIQTDTIVARNLTSGSITTAKLDAGAVTAEKIAIGSSTNVISNPCLSLSTDGWKVAGALPVTLGYGFPGLSLIGDGGGYVSATGTLPLGQNFAAYWEPYSDGLGVPCEGGSWYEAQARIGGHRCSYLVQIQFYDSAKNIIVAVNSARGVGKSGGLNLVDYSLVWVKAQAPINATRVRMIVYGVNDGGADYAQGTTPVNPYIFFTQASVGKSTPVPMSQSQPQPYAPGGVTQITGGSIVSDTIVARHILAGAVTTDKLSVGTSANVIWNSCLTGSTDGWVVGNNNTGGAAHLDVVASTSSSYLVGFGTGQLTTDVSMNGRTDLFADANWWPQSPYKGIACIAGQRWEAQARVLAAGCSAQLMIDWFDGANNLIGQSTGVTTNGPTDAGNGARTLSNYTLLSFVDTAPAGAIWASLNIRMRKSIANGAFILFTQVMLAPTYTNATQVSNWSAGGATEISGGAIRTNSIYARTIAANQITTEKLAVGNSNNLIANSCFAITAEGWTYGLGAGATSPAGLQSCASAHKEYAPLDGAGVVDTYLPVGGFVDVYSPAYTCVAGETWEAQAMVLPIASTAKCYLCYQDSTGTILGYSTPSNVIAAQGIPAASTLGGLTAFQQLQLIAVVPGGTTRISILLRFSSPQASQANGYAFITRAMLGKTVAGATQVSPWSPGGITTIGAGIIKSEAIVARTIAAGAITAEKLAIASSSNVIYNPSCFLSTDGWNFASNAFNGRIGITGSIAPSSFTLMGEGTGCMAADSLPVGNYMAGVWDENVYGIACQPGEWWEVQMQIAAHRCYGQVELQFMDSSNNVALSRRGARVAGPGGGSIIQNYGLSWTKIQAPTNAVRVRLIVYALNDNGTDIIAGVPGVQPYLFFTHAVLGRSTPVAFEASQPQPYQIGGATSISGGLIRTGAIEARTIAAGAVNADKIAANSISSDKIQANAIQATNIAAGAVTTEKLAVGNPSNVIWNPCMLSNISGWVPNGTFPSDVNFTTVVGTGLESQWLEPTFGTGLITRRVSERFAPNEYMELAWSPNKKSGISGVPTEAGQTWRFQARVIPLNCGAQLFIVFLDGAFNYISAVASDIMPPQNPPGGRNLGNYSSLVVRGITPPGTCFVYALIRGQYHASAIASNSPFVFVTQTSLGLTNINAQGMDVWAPGGVTEINGGMIATGSIRAAQIDVNDLQAAVITAGSITTSKLAAGAVVADSIAANAITTAKISAGAVQAQQIAAGAVIAEKLSVGAATNVIWNHSLIINDDGWLYVNSVPFSGHGAVVDNPYLSSAWKLTNSGTGYMSAAAFGGGDYFAAIWSPDQVGGVPVVPGSWYVAQAMLIPHRCASYVAIEWLDRNQNVISAVTSTRVYFPQPGDGLSLGNYHQGFVCGQAPAAACYGRLIIYGKHDGSADIPGIGSSPYLFYTQVSFGECYSNVTSPPPFAAGGVTTLSGGILKTNTIQARNIAAGAITTEKLSVGSGNVIWNSTCIYGTDGWQVGGYGSLASQSAFLICDKAGIVGPQWTLQGYGSGVGFWNSDSLIYNDQGFYANWYPDPAAMSVSPGKRYQAAALLQPHHINARVDIIFLDGNGNYAGEVNGNVIGDLSGYGNAGSEILYGRSAVVGTAPGNAVTAYMRWITIGVGASSRPYVFFTKAMLSEAPINATEVGPWAPGGVTSISGGVLRTNAIEARHVAANAIDAESLQADSVIAGKIAVGAVRAAQIRAGEIRTDHLAADFALISTAQIGDAIITNAKIGSLQVNGEKISSGAASSGSFSKSTARGNVGLNEWASVAIVAGTLDAHSTGFVLMISCINDYQRDNASDIFSGQAGEGSGGDSAGSGSEGSQSGNDGNNGGGDPGGQQGM